MSFVNQQYAWTASEASAAFGVLSLLVALIVNREKLMEFLKRYWIVIAVAFGVAGLWTFYEFVGRPLLRGFGRLFSQPIPIWGILVLIAVFFGIRWLWPIIAKRPEPNNNVPIPTNAPVPPRELTPEDFSVEDYTQDSIDGVWWHWTYSGNTVNIPKPICPNQNCQCDLFFREDWGRLNVGPNVGLIGSPPVTLHCPRCSFRMDFNKTRDRVLHDVMQEILSQIRTNRFRGRLYNRAKNQQAAGAGLA